MYVLPRFNGEKSDGSHSICDSFYKRNEETPFLKQVVTGNEKWIIYNNVERKRSWGKRNELPLATPKTDLHPKKVMLCV